MRFVFGKGEDSEGSDIDDLILISISTLAFVIILSAAYLITKRFSPSLVAKIEGIMRMIFFNMIITAFLKAYLRLSLSSCEKSFVALTGEMFLDERLPADSVELTMKDIAVSALIFVSVAISGPIAFLCLKLTEENLGDFQF
jgi:hypothetical protein